jgi:hypothetical protein
MNSEITRLAYEAPKLDVQLLLPQVYVMATASCKSSGPDGLGNPGDNGVPECASNLT